MGKLLVIFTLVHLALGASVVDVTCPDSCTCQVKEGYLESSCTSYDFIKKLTSQHISTVVRLNINNAGLVNVDSKLWELKNINHLDLSNNRINYLPASFPYLPKLKTLNLSMNHLTELISNEFPKNLEVLDLSQNNLNNFPKSLIGLKQLKTIYMGQNPIDCDCNNLFIYEQLLGNGVSIPDHPTCYYPKEFYGKTLDSVNCSMISNQLINAMLGDQGSGNGDQFSDAETEFIEDGLLSADKHTHEEQIEEMGEGSGDEGSGYEIPIQPIIPVEQVIPSLPTACHFNCSTPRPVGSSDEQNASPPPGVKEGINILFEDLANKKHESGEDAAKNEEKVAPEKQTPIEEITFHRKEVDAVNNESDKRLVETFPTNTTVLGEMERASWQDSNSNSIYVIIGLFVAFVAIIAIYTVKKRNKRRAKRRNDEKDKGFGEEMKTFGNSAEKPQIDKIPIRYENEKAPIVETAPLLNGQNGKINEEPKPQLSDTNSDNISEPEIILRNNDRSDLLTPQPERVTIKAGEIPDSIPKTPLLVHRLKNSDGELITTPILN